MSVLYKKKKKNVSPLIEGILLEDELFVTNFLSIILDISLLLPSVDKRKKATGESELLFDYAIKKDGI